jgi:hypothetical protein
VKKVAVYRDRVAVQLPSRVVLYELAAGPDGTPGEWGAAITLLQLKMSLASCWHATTQFHHPWCTRTPSSERLHKAGPTLPPHNALLLSR